MKKNINKIISELVIVSTIIIILSFVFTVSSTNKAIASKKPYISTKPIICEEGNYVKAPIVKNKIKNANYTYTSSNDNIATIDYEIMKVEQKEKELPIIMGNKDGVATITCKQQIGKKITVIGKIKVIVKVRVNFAFELYYNPNSHKDNIKFLIEEQKQIDLKKMWEYGDSEKNEGTLTPKYTSSDKKVATVSATGTLNALKNGKTTIIMTIGHSTKKMNFTVTKKDNGEKEKLSREIIKDIGKLKTETTVSDIFIDNDKLAKVNKKIEKLESKLEAESLREDETSHFLGTYKKGDMYEILITNIEKRNEAEKAIYKCIYYDEEGTFLMGDMKLIDVTAKGFTVKLAKPLTAEEVIPYYVGKELNKDTKIEFKIYGHYKTSGILLGEDMYTIEYENGEIPVGRKFIVEINGKEVRGERYY